MVGIIASTSLAKRIGQLIHQGVQINLVGKPQEALGKAIPEPIGVLGFCPHGVRL